MYVINGVLHAMIAPAAQAPGVIMEACDEEEGDADELASAGAKAQI